MPATFFDQLHAATPRIRVTYTLIFLNALAWLATLFHGVDAFSPRADRLLGVGGNFAPYTAEQPWRLASSIFIHAGFVHLLLNMWVLLELGKIGERFYGSVQFALIFLLSGLIGSLASLYFTAQHAVSVGASGAVYGVAGAISAALLAHNNKIPGSVIRHLRLPLILFVAISMLFGIWTDWIDNASHAGGFVAGFLMGAAMIFRFNVQRYRRDGLSRALATVISILVLAVLLWHLAPLPSA